MKRHLLRTLRIAVLATAGMTSAHAEAPADLASRHTETSGEYERITSELSLSDARQKTLADEIARIRKDNASITTALIQAAKTEKKLAEDVAGMESRLSDLQEQCLSYASIGTSPCLTIASSPRRAGPDGWRMHESSCGLFASIRHAVDGGFAPKA